MSTLCQIGMMKKLMKNTILYFCRLKWARGLETEQRVVQMSSEKDKVTYMLQ